MPGAASNRSRWWPTRMVLPALAGFALAVAPPAVADDALPLVEPADAPAADASGPSGADQGSPPGQDGGKPAPAASPSAPAAPGGTTNAPAAPGSTTSPPAAPGGTTDRCAPGAPAPEAGCPAPPVDTPAGGAADDSCTPGQDGAGACADPDPPVADEHSAPAQDEAGTPPPAERPPSHQQSSSASPDAAPPAHASAPAPPAPAPPPPEVTAMDNRSDVVARTRTTQRVGSGLLPAAGRRRPPCRRSMSRRPGRWLRPLRAPTRPEVRQARAGLRTMAAPGTSHVSMPAGRGRTAVRRRRLSSTRLYLPGLPAPPWRRRSPCGACCSRSRHSPPTSCAASARVRSYPRRPAFLPSATDPVSRTSAAGRACAHPAAVVSPLRKEL